MKMVVRKRDGRVVMYADNSVVVDTELFDVVDYSPSEEELDKFKQNDIPNWDGKKVSFTDNPLRLKRERDESAKALYAKLHAGNATDQEKDEVLKYLLENK